MAATKNSDLIIKLSNLQIRLSKSLEHQLSCHGISFTEFLVLFNLKSSPGSRMRRIDLAESIGMSASGITRLLSPMVKIGLVKKESNPRDARVSLVKLTSAGEKIFGEAEQSFNYATEKLTSGLTDKQKLRLTELVGVLS